MSIVVVKKDQAAQRVPPTPVTQEEYLQMYILENPGVLPLDDIREGLRLFIFAREFPTASGPIDAIGIDDHGAVYIVETKLFKNPDKRLVVAQALDYGAALWSGLSDFAEVERGIDGIVRKKFGMSFREKLEGVFGVDSEEVVLMLERFKRDLADGKFTFVILMDHLHDRLKDLIAFINANSNFRVLGCETEFYRYDDLEILLPKLYGAEVKKTGASSPSAPRKKWNLDYFFDDLKARVSADAVEATRQLYAHCEQRAEQISWGTGSDRGSFNPKHKGIGARSMFTMYSDGTIRFNFGWLNDDDITMCFRDALRAALVAKTSLAIPEDCVEKFPAFEADTWVPQVEGVVTALTTAMEEALNKRINADRAMRSTEQTD